jgi:O-antigen ligase
MGTGKLLREPPPEPGFKCPVSSTDFRFSSFEFRSFGRVAALGLVLGYTAFQWGGVLRSNQYVVLLAVGALAILLNLRHRREEAPPAGRAVGWAVVLLGYVLLQAIPLPVGVLRVLSPGRAPSVDALERIGAKLRFASLSASPTATFQSFLLVCGYLLVFLLVRALGRRLWDRRWLAVWPIVAIAALEGGLGLWQNFGRTGEAAQWGTYVNHNHYSGFLEMALPFAVMYPVALLGRARRRGKASLAPSLAACGVFGLAALIVAGIIHSFSRMGFIAMLFSILVMAALAFVSSPVSWFRRSRKRRWGAAGLLAVALLAGVAFLPSERLILRFAELTSSDPTAGGRAKLWAATIPLIKAYPVFGCGLGGYETVFLKFKTFDPLVRDDFAHNDYLQLLAELGLVGFAMLAVAACSLVRSTLHQAVASQDPEERYFAVACAGALAAILLHSLADFNLYIPANAMLLAWIAGMSPQARPAPAILNRWEQLASGPAQGLRAA